MFGWPESFHFILGDITEKLSWAQGWEGIKTPNPGRHLQPKAESDPFPSSFDRVRWVLEAELNTLSWGNLRRLPRGGGIGNSPRRAETPWRKGSLNMADTAELLLPPMRAGRV